MDFTISMDQTIDDLMLFNQTLRKSNKILTVLRSIEMVALAIGSLVVLVSVIVLTIAGKVEEIIGSAIVFVCMVLLMIYIPDLTAKWVYRRQRQLLEMHKEMHFTDDSVIIRAVNSKQEIENTVFYDAYIKVLENETHFYLMTTKNAGEIVPKKLLSFEQQEFIRYHFHGKIVKVKMKG